ncbi:HNH endonuclease [Priestia megaterium]|uniref:HNH endonuclease n=1 Tax=Priestia megaterium TaxID=1404 RepID=UPI0009908829|nr:HNH endonuclease signature motif containing protein [Priestia megaterium]AQU77052.1 hypothetical protein BUW91_27990 [Priestia megaterium]
MSAAKRMIELLKLNVGKEISRDNLAAVAKISDWPRTIRNLRQNDGWDIRPTNVGYILHSLKRKETGKKRKAISTKLRYEVLHRDESKCKRCGRTPDDGIKLHVDHKIPVEWGGKTTVDNLWTLCDICNQGKKNWFSDEDSNKMKQIMTLGSGYRRLAALFELNPNKFLTSTKISLVADIQDWPRTLRDIRQKEDMNIKPKVVNKERGYIYYPS